MHEVSSGFNLGGWTMSLSQSTEVFERPKADADRNHREYGLVLTLVCVVLALILAGAIFTPVSIGSGIDNETSLVGP
jgi:hypothetical protein